MEFLIILFGFIIICHVARYLIQLLFEGLCFLMYVTLLGIWEVLKWAGRCTKRMLLWLGPNLRDGAMLLFYLVSETLRGARGESARGDDADDDEEDEGYADEEGAGSEDRYQAALAMLGLPALHTRAEFKSAYRRAIRAAHPDKGGNTEAAQAINEARDLIARLHGWR